MTITTGPVDAALLAAAQAREADIRQAARETHARIAGQPVPGSAASAGPGTVNTHPDGRGGMSNTATTSSSSSGAGFAGLLTIAFIVLKLLHKIAWSWIWVLSPLWISAAAGVAVLLVVGLVLLVVAAVKR